jgi:TRAP-type C4-dicarboxylate transport system permease small subunit
MGKVLEVFITFLLILMTALMFAQFLGRFIFKNGIFWAEELSRFTMVTMVYMGAGLACKNRDHIRITILDEIIKGPAHKALDLLIAVLSIAFLAAIARYGFAVLPIVSTQKSANMQITMNLIYMMMPIGSCIMIFYILVEILELFLAPKKDGAEKAAEGNGT